MDTKTLEESCMGFELPGGKKFLIHENDIKKISEKIFTHIITLEQEKVMMVRDTGLDRANKLYEVYQKEKEQMTEKGRQSCLTKIIKYLTEQNYELDTLKNLVEDAKKKQK